MNKVIKTALIAVLANIALAALWIIGASYSSGDYGLGWILGGGILTGIILLVQLITGIVFAAGTNNKEIGKGLLLATGICLLIGLSVCGSMLL